MKGVLSRLKDWRTKSVETYLARGLVELKVVKMTVEVLDTTPDCSY